MRLLRAEWTRLFARRFTQVMLLLLLLVLGAIAGGIAFDSSSPSEAEYAAAEREAQWYNQEALQQVQECEQAHAAGGDAALEWPTDCSILAAEYTADMFLPWTFNFRAEAPELVIGFGGLLALFGLLVGASFIGAEHSSGGVTNLLLWQPRRIPLLLGKLTALLTGVLLIGVVIGGAWVAGLWLIARWRGVTGELTRGFQESLALTGARSLGLALAVTIVGFALASLGRRTSTALGALLAYGVIGEIGIRMVLGLLEVDYVERYVLSSYVAAWLDKQYEIFGSYSCDDYGSCIGESYTIPLWQGAVVLGVLTTVLLVAAVAVFRRRDIT